MRHPKVEGIYRAAVEVFAHSGFDQAKVDDIAQQAGVAKGTIYYHFQSKEELFLGMISEGLEKLVNYVQRSINTSEDPVEQLTQVVKAQFQFFIENAKLAKIILQEAFGTKERQQEFRNHIKEYLLLIEGLLRRGREKGTFDVRDLSGTASAIFGSLSVASLQMIFSMEEEGIAQQEDALHKLSEAMVQFIFCGIKKMS